MKAGLLSILGLSALAVAQPGGDHRRFHKKHIQQRDYQVNTEVKTDVVVVYAPAVTAYVDSNGKPCDSNGNPLAPAPAAATPAPAPQPVAPAPQPAAPAPSYQQAAPAPKPASPAPAPKATSYSNPSPAPASSAPAPAPQSSAPSYSPAPSSGGSSGLGITYTPYQPQPLPCKDQAQIDEDIAKIFQNGDYSIIRTYGADCNQNSKIMSAIKKAGKNAKLFVSLPTINNIEAECQQLVQDMGGDWSGIDTIAVGNELVNSGQATPEQVAAAVSTAKGCLTGYTGPVVTVDTFIAIINNPAICNIGDYVAANCHAFFDGGVKAEDAGQFVLDQAQKVSQVCNRKKVVITESGWPHEGSANKVAVPSRENQAAAISSLKSKFTSNLFLFSALDETWKSDSGDTFGCEKYWGIYQ